MSRKSHARHKADASNKLASGFWNVIKTTVKAHRKHKKTWGDFVVVDRTAKQKNRKGYELGDISKAAWKKVSSLWKKELKDTGDKNKDNVISKEELEAFKPL